MADPREVVLTIEPEDGRKLEQLEHSVVEWSVRLALLDSHMSTIRENLKGIFQAKQLLLSSMMQKGGIVPGTVSGASVTADGHLVLKVVDPE